MDERRVVVARSLHAAEEFGGEGESCGVVVELVGVAGATELLIEGSASLRFWILANRPPKSTAGCLLSSAQGADAARFFLLKSHMVVFFSSAGRRNG